MKNLIVFASIFLGHSAFGQTVTYIGNNEVLLEKPEIIPNEKRLAVIAPGKMYTMDKPLFVALAKLLIKEGYIVARFNWGFVKLSTEPSTDLIQEGIELDKVISTLQDRFAVSKANTYLIAKSFGTRVLLRSKMNNADHISLMTPNCDKENTFEATYAPIFQNNLRININISIDDPYCDTGQIYDFISLKHRKVTLLTTYGDHNFKVGKFSKRNQDLVLLHIVNWAKQK